jgi:hypothetical protein
LNPNSLKTPIKTGVNICLKAIRTSSYPSRCYLDLQQLGASAFAQRISCEGSIRTVLIRHFPNWSSQFRSLSLTFSVSCPSLPNNNGQRWTASHRSRGGGK